MDQRPTPPHSGRPDPSLPDADQTAGAPHRSERSIAVAIKREGEGEAGTPLEAPRVVAKGEGAIAEQILAIAFDRDIKVRSDADLAEILSAVEVDSEIPLEALAAVAEILTYVYRVTQAPGQGYAPPQPGGLASSFAQNPESQT